MRKSILTLLAMALIGLMSVIGLSGVRAQATPEGLPQQGTDTTHPAHIHSGTCDALGDVVFPLNDVSGPDIPTEGTPLNMPVMGNLIAIPVMTSVTTIDASIEDIVASDHAINVHESAENIGNYIACGEIGGMMIGDTTINFGVVELNGSGFTGIASLYDNGDSTTTVYVYLINTSEIPGGGMATPVGSPVDGDMDLGTPES